VREGTFARPAVRLNVVNLKIPPLRTPAESSNAQHFAKKYADANGVPLRRFPPKQAGASPRWQACPRTENPCIVRLMAQGDEIGAEAFDAGRRRLDSPGRARRGHAPRADRRDRWSAAPSRCERSVWSLSLLASTMRLSRHFDPNLAQQLNNMRRRLPITPGFGDYQRCRDV